MKTGLAQWSAGIAVLAGTLTIARPATAQMQYVQYANYKNQNYCLDTAGHNANNGSNIVISACNPNGQYYTSQFWGTDTNDPFYNPWGTYYSERNLLNSNKCLGIANSSPNEGAQAVIWDCFGPPPKTGHWDQYWALVPAPYPHDGCYIFWNNFSGMLLGVAGGNMTEGAHVVQWPEPENGPFTPDQLWCPARGT